MLETCLLVDAMNKYTVIAALCSKGGTATPGGACQAVRWHRRGSILTGPDAVTQPLWVIGNLQGS